MALSNQKILNKALTVAFLILLGTALVLGYLILVKDGVIKTGAKSNAGQSASATNQQASAKAAGATVSALLRFPAKDASDADNKAFFQSLQASAKSSDYLDIAGCQPQPQVIIVDLNKPVKVRNQDNVDHKISFTSGGPQYTVPKGVTKDITFDFSKGTGYYGYFCDAGKSPVGVFFVK